MPVRREVASFQDWSLAAGWANALWVPPVIAAPSKASEVRRVITVMSRLLAAMRSWHFAAFACVWIARLESTDTSMSTPEARARANIDGLLTVAGWPVC